jgi:hypothetical protein
MQCAQLYMSGAYPVEKMLSERLGQQSYVESLIKLENLRLTRRTEF